jgi:hypothetical protein
VATPVTLLIIKHFSGYKDGNKVATNRQHLSTVPEETAASSSWEHKWRLLAFMIAIFEKEK